MLFTKSFLVFFIYFKERIKRKCNWIYTNYTICMLKLDELALSLSLLIKWNFFCKIKKAMEEMNKKKHKLFMLFNLLIKRKMRENFVLFGLIKNINSCNNGMCLCICTNASFSLFFNTSTWNFFIVPLSMIDEYLDDIWKKI